MRKTLLLMTFAAAGAAFSIAAQAQIKCWNDANGKRVCGDAPPAGAKVTTLKAPSGGSAPTPAPDAKGASKAPLTPAEREQEARKRQADSAKAAEKAAQEKQDADRKRETCERARAALAQYESGQRIAMTDAKGERYFMDENQLAAESAKARQVMQESCK